MIYQFSQNQLKHVVISEPQGSVLNKPETPGTVYTVKEGGAIDLPCVAQGFPLPTYTWYKVNSVTGNQEELSATPSIFPRHTVLSVVGARKSDAGRYNCRVYNQVGFKLSLSCSFSERHSKKSGKPSNFNWYILIGRN